MGKNDHELSKEQRMAVLQKAAEDLSTRYHFICSIEQGMLIIQANWEDTTYINGPGLSREQRSYRYIVRIKPNGKIATLDVYADDYASVGLGGMSIGRREFAGKAVTFNWEAQIGKDNQNGERGLIINKFSSKSIQDPVKEYFTALGYKFQAYSLSDDWHGISPNMRMVIGGLFVFGSGIMIPGIIYSLINESDKLVYVGIAAYIFAFFLFGIGILVSGIKDMLKQKRNEEWD